MTPEKFWSRMDKSGPAYKDLGPCWHWTGARYTNGYGHMHPNVATHRQSWLLTRGPIPDGLWVLHHCDNPPCCNPAHLWLGTDLDNKRDMVEKGRQYRGERHWTRTHPEKRAIGERHGLAKITAADVLLIRWLAAEGVPGKSIARHLEVGRGVVYRVLSGECWSHVA